MPDRPDSTPRWPGPSVFTGSDSPELVAELAHTLRSRLTSIVFLAESLYADSAGWEPSQRRQLAFLAGSAVKMSVFTSNLMELARGGDDLVGIAPQPLSVGELLRETRDTLHPLTVAADVSLVVRGTAAGRRLGHPMALQRILVSLTTAAFELTQQGEVEIVARARGVRCVEFAIEAPDARFALDSPDALERPVVPRPEGGGWSWRPVALSIATARHLLGKLGVELSLEAGDERALRFRFDVDLPPVEVAAKGSAEATTDGGVQRSGGSIGPSRAGRTEGT